MMDFCYNQINTEAAYGTIKSDNRKERIRLVSSISMMLALAAVFLALILNLATDNRFHRAWIRFELVFVGAAGIFFYGYGYAWTQGVNGISFLRALFSLCKMFVGSSDLDAIKAAPQLQNRLVLEVFWLAHFLAYYVMASAAIAAVGQRVLRSLRVTLLRRGPLLLIYGVNARSVAYGRERAGKGRCGIVYVDREYDSAFDSSIHAFGAVVEKHASALAGNAAFLKQLNMKAGKRRMEVAALKNDADDNLRYARNLMRAMAEAGIRTEKDSSPQTKSVRDSAAAAPAGAAMLKSSARARTMDRNFFMCSPPLIIKL